jgi:hypothetical protein
MWSKNSPRSDETILKRHWREADQDLSEEDGMSACNSTRSLTIDQG